MPEVSIIVPNYNHASFLSQRLDSVFNQTFNDFEVILLDDHSTDNSVEVLTRYASRPQVSKFVVNPVNSGSPFQQWVTGTQFCTGRYVWIAESDDYCDPTFLQKCIDVFKKGDDIKLVYSASQGIDVNGAPDHVFVNWKSEVSPEYWNTDYIRKGRDEINNVLSIRNTIGNTSSVVIDRQALVASVSKVAHFRYTGDWYLWISILSAKQSSIGYVSAPLNFFRAAHDQSTRNKKSMEFQRADEWFECLFAARKFIGAKGYPPMAVSDMRFMMLIVPLQSMLRYQSISRIAGWMFRDSLLTRLVIWSFVKRGGIWIKIKFTR